jgi:hypothetical protein
MTKDFVASIDAFAEHEGIDIIEFEKGQRKEDLAKEYLSRFEGEEGVLFIGKAQEKASVIRTTRCYQPGQGAGGPGGRLWPDRPRPGGRGCPRGGVPAGRHERRAEATPREAGAASGFDPATTRAERASWATRRFPTDHARVRGSGTCREHPQRSVYRRSSIPEIATTCLLPAIVSSSRAWG